MIKELLAQLYSKLNVLVKKNDILQMNWVIKVETLGITGVKKNKKAVSDVETESHVWSK